MTIRSYNNLFYGVAFSGYNWPDTPIVNGG
jgi:hypothetical protein